MALEAWGAKSFFMYARRQARDASCNNAEPEAKNGTEDRTAHAEDETEDYAMYDTGVLQVSMSGPSHLGPAARADGRKGT